jgi:argininosuccinate lyase
VGKAAAAATARGAPIAALTAADWRSFHPKFEKDVLRAFDARRSLRRRELTGAPGPRQVARQIARWEKALRRDPR